MKSAFSFLFFLQDRPAWDNGICVESRYLFWHDRIGDLGPCCYGDFK